MQYASRNPAAQLYASMLQGVDFVGWVWAVGGGGRFPWGVG